MNHTMKAYLNDILVLRLKKDRIKDEFIETAVSYVKEQMYSLLKNWNDIAFRQGILITGAEEGYFYEPKAKIDVRCFVVATIRNSLLETAASEEYKKAGLKQPVSEEQIRTLTQEAVTYFKGVQFETIAAEIKEAWKNDFYGEIVADYPVAWRALQELGLCLGGSVHYEKVPYKTPFVLEELEGIEIKEHIKYGKVVLSGIDESFDKRLLQILKRIEKDELNYFYVDSFKMLTRNIKKLLKVMEFLLTHEKCFATSNFYIENGYIEKRTTLRRAAHTEQQAFANLCNRSGTWKKHKIILKAMENQMKRR